MTGNIHEVLGLEEHKIDIDEALLIIEAYKNPTKILLHPGLLERIFELLTSNSLKTQENTKNNEINNLQEIVDRAILHCTIVGQNPQLFLHDTEGGMTIPGAIFLDPNLVSKASKTLPLLEGLNERILKVLLDNK